MKLRIRGNSLRLRLQRSEVQRLGETGNVEEAIYFDSHNSLRYVIESIEGLAAIQALFIDKTIRVQVPAECVRDWVRTEEIGITGEQTLTNGEALRILIEKDLQCLKPRTSAQWEDESAAYPNPNPTCGHSR